MGGAKTLDNRKVNKVVRLWFGYKHVLVRCLFCLDLTASQHTESHSSSEPDSSSCWRFVTETLGQKVADVVEHKNVQHIHVENIP